MKWVNVAGVCVALWGSICVLSAHARSPVGAVITEQKSVEPCVKGQSELESDRTLQDRCVAADALLEPYTSDKPGIAILVSSKGRIIYERELGSADLEHNTPITADTPFHIASVSKQFTAFAIAQLAQAGKVDLNADIHDYLPELKSYGNKVTVSDLIFHISGLRDQWGLAVLSGTPMSGLIRQSSILAVAENQTGLNFVPRTEFRYSNTGYSLLAEIVARQSGMSFREYMRKKVFAPLGMNHTLVYDDASEILPGRAMSYAVKEDGTVRQARLNYSNYGATSVHSTTQDLLRWSRELLSPSVFDVRLIRSLAQTGQLSDGRELTYAYGMIDSTIAGHRALSHGGSDAGYRSFIASFGDDDASIIVLSNGQADVKALTAKLAETFLGSDPSPPIFVAPDPRQIAKLSGYYLDSWGPGLNLVVEKDKLFAVAGAVKKEINFTRDGRFYMGSPPSAVVLLPNGDLSQDDPTSGLKQIYRRAMKFEASPEQLKEIVGDYRSDELDVTYKIIVDNGHLALKSLRTETVYLNFADKDNFENSEIRLSLLRSSDNSVRGFTLASGRVRGVEFVRTGNKTYK